MEHLQNKDASEQNGITDDVSYEKFNPEYYNKITKCDVCKEKEHYIQHLELQLERAQSRSNEVTDNILKRFGVGGDNQTPAQQIPKDFRFHKPIRTPSGLRAAITNKANEAAKNKLTDRISEIEAEDPELNTNTGIVKG